jgi:methylmalonyl-CoA decarboxylase subunit alpha
MDNIESLLKIKEQSELGGGISNIEAQHNLNKLTARERINVLLDEGSFIEIGALVDKNAAGVITGYGTIEGRLAYVFSQDYTVEGGSITLSNSKKIVRIMEMAMKMGAPLIQIFDSVGAKLTNGIQALSYYGEIIKKNAEISGVIPQIAIAAGPCTGAAAISAAMSDFTIIVENSGEIYVNSPEKLSEKEINYVGIDAYGDALSSSRSGVCQLTAKDDKEALELARRLMDYLPENNLELVPNDDSSYLLSTEDRLNELAKEENYDIYEIVSLIADKDSLIEINGNFRPEVLTGFLKINGLTVGVMASDKIENNEGLCIKALDKLTRFVKLCSCFNIPILSLVDTKGFAVSFEEERKGLALAISKLMYTLIESRVPKVSIVIGEAYGSAYLALAGKEAAFDVTYAWPSARVSVGEVETLIRTLYGDEILKAENPKEKENDLIDKYKAELTDPYAAAEAGCIDDVILPSESRVRLFGLFDMLQSKREIRYPKKHGSILI